MFTQIVEVCPAYCNYMIANESSLEKEISRLSRVLGHPARISILLAMAEKGNVVKGEIIAVPDVAPATVIQHLRELKKAGLIHGRIFGLNANYYIDQEAISKLCGLYEEFNQRMNKPSSKSE